MSKPKPTGLSLKATPALLSLLEKAANDTNLNEDVRKEAAALAAADNISWKRLRPLYAAIREGRTSEDGVVLLHEACKGSEIVLPVEPVKRQNPELVARLEQLQRKEEERKYSAMVRDVTTAERDAEALRDNSLVTYKDQIGYGIHVIVVMGVFYGIGHLAASSMSSKTSVVVAGGLLGMTFAMLMETVLLIIRTSDFGKRQQARRGGLSAQPFSGVTLPHSTPRQRAMPTGNHLAQTQGPQTVEIGPKKKK